MDPHIFESPDPDPGSQHVADPTDPDPKHWVIQCQTCFDPLKYFLNSTFSIVRHYSKFFLIIYSCLIVQTRTYSSVFSKISSTTYTSVFLKSNFHKTALKTALLCLPSFRWEDWIYKNLGIRSEHCVPQQAGDHPEQDDGGREGDGERDICWRSRGGHRVWSFQSRYTLQVEYTQSSQIKMPQTSEKSTKNPQKNLL